MTYPTIFSDTAKVTLTPREAEILHFIANGFTAKLIARELGISVHTVRTHRDNLRRKFGARNTAQLAYYYHAMMKSGAPSDASNTEVDAPPRRSALLLEAGASL